MYWKAKGYITNNMTWKLRGDNYPTHDNTQYEMRWGAIKRGRFLFMMGYKANSIKSIWDVF